MNDLLHLTAPIQIQAGADGKRTATFTILANSGGEFSAPNWPSSVIDLNGLEISGTIPVLVGHDEADLDALAGQGVASVEGGRLYVRGQLTQASAGGALILGLARDSVQLQASIGVDPTEVEFIRPGEKVSINGRTLAAGQRGLRVVRRGRLREVSLVSVGADPNTAVSIAAQGAKNMVSQTTNPDPNTAEVPDELRAAWDRSGLSDSERTELRLREFHRDYGSVLPDFGQGLIRAVSTGGLTWADAEREILRAENRALRLRAIRSERPPAPAIHASSRDTSPEILQAAFCKTAGLRNLEKAFKPEVLEASDRFRAIGIQELLLNCAQQNGYSGRPMVSAGNLREILQAAFTPQIQAAFSTQSITTLLTQAGGKFLLEGFNAIPQTWREVAAIRTVNDFKQVTAFRLTTSLEYEELPPTGEIKHGTMGQESYTMQAKTYAKMLGLTRHDIINDDLGAFDQLRTRLGMGAVLKINKEFWTAWLAASDAGTFWTAARGNFQTGVGTALGELGLAAAEILLTEMAGTDGNLIGLQPDRILVPPVLGVVARKLFVSQEIRDTAADTYYPTSNIYFGRFRPIIVPELSNAGYPGHSDTAWWLCCDPAILASAAMCFLNGVQTPTIESSDVDFDQLGIQLRGYHDFGMAMSEYRASVHSVGA